jgi:hypothetical protein
MPYGIVLLMALIFISLGIIFKQPLTRQLVSWKLLAQPASLTELYFTDHLHLPTTYIPNHSQSFAFTVHNLERQTTSYHYQIIVQSTTGNEKPLASGVFTLANDQSLSVPIKIQPLDMGDRAKIIVKLSSRNQTISYWVTRK